MIRIVHLTETSGAKNASQGAVAHQRTARMLLIDGQAGPAAHEQHKARTSATSHTKAAYRATPKWQIPEQAELSNQVLQILRDFIDDCGWSRHTLAKTIRMSRNTADKMFGRNYTYKTRGLIAKNIEALMSWSELPEEARPLLERLAHLSPHLELRPDGRWSLSRARSGAARRRRTSAPARVRQSSRAASASSSPR
jgi:hypothetical protein